MTPFVKDLWKRAQEALRVARQMKTSSDHRPAIACYAAFYALSAFFATRNLEFKTHKAVELALHRELIRPGQIPAEIGRQFRRPRPYHAGRGQLLPGVRRSHRCSDVRSFSTGLIKSNPCGKDLRGHPPEPAQCRKPVRDLGWKPRCLFQNWLDRNKVTPQVDEPKTLFRILIEKTSGKASYAELRKILGGLAPNRRGVKLPRKELLIHERAVHLDSLAERLKDARVRKVIQCILVGAMDPTNPEAPAITGVGA